MPNISGLETKTKVQFNNKDLLKTALTHRSYLNENRAYPLPHNERLEFLGDAVLELITTEYLYQNFDNPEGELTNLRSSLVNHRTLAQVGQEIGLEEHILMSKGEAKDTGRARQAILANAIEALIGAIYLDQGKAEAKQFVKRFILAHLPEIMKDQAYLDPKSQLQEIIQDKMNVTPHYEVLSESGPDHNKTFVVAVFMAGERVGEGAGPSKREAEVEAARDALEKQSF